MAQAYESLAQYEKALYHAELCVEQLPTSFEALALAARSASELKKYQVAYTHAKKALMDSRDPNLPGVINIIFRILLYIPGLKGLRTANEAGVNVYVQQTTWLKEYVEWYEKNSPNN